MKIKTFLLSVIATLSQTGTSAQVEDQKILNISKNAAAYDSIVALWQADIISESFDNFAQEYISLDTTKYLQAIGASTDAWFQARLNAIVSPIHLPYNNIVRKQIVAYTTTHKSITQRMLSYSKYYFPIIEQELDAAGVPLELKFLAVIESALQPAIRSRAGAVGLWQFMLPTAKNYGLEVTTMVDERCDPVKSTRAAAQYLLDLYNIYDDWTLALAAYNYGPGNVNKALKRAGSNAKTYWDIYHYLPGESRDYIPAFVAIAYAYRYHRDYNIKPFDTPQLPPTDTIMITRNLHMEQISSTIDIPIELLRLLNPQYRQDIIPGIAKPHALILPCEEISNFIGAQEAIYAKDSIYITDNFKSNIVNPAGITGGTRYKVRSGDNLGAIAQRHGVTVTQLIRWNNLPNAHKLRIGQTLKVSIK